MALVGEEGMLGGEITITTASAQRGFYSVYATNCYEYFILALWFIHVQPNDLLPYGIVQGFFFFFFPVKFDCHYFHCYFHEVWGLYSVFGVWTIFFRHSQGSRAQGSSVLLTIWKLQVLITLKTQADD